MMTLRTSLVLGFMTFASGVSAIAAPIIELVPISASGAHSINGHRITLDHPGQRVFLEVFISNWDPESDGVPLITGFQVSLDSSGYSSGTLGTLVAATESCNPDVECPDGTCVNFFCDGGGNAGQLCNANAECEAAFGPRAACGYPFHTGECTPGFQDGTRSDWILNGVNGFGALDLGTANIRWGGVVNGGGIFDTGAIKYAGTLVLDVAAGTNGSFTLGFNPEPASEMQDIDLLDISPLSFVSAIIKVRCQSDADCDDGSDCTQDSCDTIRGNCSNTPLNNESILCCNPVGGATTVIDDQNDCTDDVCNRDDGTVTHDPLPAGTACGGASDTLCDNPDTCDGGTTCLPNFEPVGTVCRGSAGVCDIEEACDGSSAACPPDNLVPSGTVCRTAVGGCDVEEACTGDSPACPPNQLQPVGTVCRAATDLCDAVEACDGADPSCPPDAVIVAGFFCRPAADDCDAPEACDGVLASCPIDVSEPFGTACGNSADTDCTDPDTCDGAGACVANDEIVGTACGDLSDTDCTDPDTCDGGGACQVNHAPNGLVCTDDGNDCTDDVCAAGGCTHPDKPVGAACGDASDTDCDNPDSCNGVGVCLDNIKTNGLVCTDDGNDCTNDVCAAGDCSHPNRLVGAACGDGTDTDCDNPDTCDGAGFCRGNLEPDGTTCGADGNDCTDDVCANGGCTHPNTPTGLACGDANNTDCTDPDTCDGAGACQDNHAAAATACGDPADTDCDNPDTCNGAGACNGNLEPDDLPCSDDGNDCTRDICATGACVHPNEATGTLCGDPSDTDCTAPDTCSAGTCLDNHDPDGAMCTSDFNDCTDDVCDSGACTHPDKPSGVACGDGADTDCDNPDTCDGAGFCRGNLEPDGTTCGADGNECTDDVCASGGCTHPNTPTGSACGDANNTDCTDPDTCDGAGACQDNHAAAATACGDPTDTDCDNPDTCNGAGACRGNLEPDDLPCPDDGNDCTRDICATGACVHPNEATGTLCGDPSDTDCTAPDTCSAGTCLDNHDPDGAMCTSDFNDCTDDVCDSGACTHPDKPSGVACGDGADTDCDNPDTCDGAGFCRGNFEPDGTTCGADGNDCTDDVCANGGCTHPNTPTGLACGDANNTDCTDPDTCDGAGTCQDNHAPAAAACGSLSDTDCDNPDTCDGSGSCEDNLELDGLACTDDGNECTDDVCANGACSHPDEATGTLCGDPSDTDCTAPDTCSAGTCLDNHDPDGAMCTSDFNDCTDDVCDTGACTHPDTAVGTACGDGADTDCDNPDTCDGVGFCRGNLEPDGTGCTSDLNDCTDDVCGDGLCDHVDHPVGFSCGDASDTDCTDPDTCDGTGTCQDNHVAAATACGDQTDTACTDPDTCDGDGACLDNHEADDTSCEDDLFCNGEDLCAAGVCEHAGSPCGGPCDEENDACLCEAPLVEAVGNRYLRITPQPPGSGPQAIFIKPDCPAAIGRYLNPPTLLDLDGDDGFIESVTDFAGTVAVAEGFLTPAEWGELYVYDEDVTPETTYIVWGDCGSPGNPGLSDSTVVTTPRFGDAIGEFVLNVGWSGPDGSVNITEALACIMTFSHALFAPPIYVTDLAPVGIGEGCAPNQEVKLVDIITFIRAFQGLEYREVLQCPTPCP